MKSVCSTDVPGDQIADVISHSGREAGETVVALEQSAEIVFRGGIEPARDGANRARAVGLDRGPDWGRQVENELIVAGTRLEPARVCAPANRNRSPSARSSSRRRRRAARRAFRRSTSQSDRIRQSGRPRAGRCPRRKRGRAKAGALRQRTRAGTSSANNRIIWIIRPPTPDMSLGAIPEHRLCLDCAAPS